jgi:hypothetical protein
VQWDIVIASAVGGVVALLGTAVGEMYRTRRSRREEEKAAAVALATLAIELLGEVDLQRRLPPRQQDANRFAEVVRTSLHGAAEAQGRLAVAGRTSVADAADKVLDVLVDVMPVVAAGGAGDAELERLSRLLSQARLTLLVSVRPKRLGKPQLLTRASD